VYPKLRDVILKNLKDGVKIWGYTHGNKSDCLGSYLFTE
jgi:hypothetical protein